MSEIVCSAKGVTFGVYCGPHGLRMAQITLPSAYTSIPLPEVDRLCIEWINFRATQMINEVGR